MSPGLPGGINEALDVTAPAVIKATPGILVRVQVLVAGSAGNLTINDCATLGAAAVANEIASIPFGSLSLIQPLVFEWPCATGIVLSAIPTGGAVSISYS